MEWRHGDAWAELGHAERLAVCAGTKRLGRRHGRSTALFRTVKRRRPLGPAPSMPRSRRCRTPLARAYGLGKEALGGVSAPRCPARSVGDVDTGLLRSRRWPTAAASATPLTRARQTPRTRSAIRATACSGASPSSRMLEMQLRAGSGAPTAGAQHAIPVVLASVKAAAQGLGLIPRPSPKCSTSGASAWCRRMSS